MIVSLMSDAMSFLNEAMADSAGVEVVYARGAYTVNLTPVVGQTRFASTIEGNARLEWGDRDYLVIAAELILNGSQVEPAVGDRITETVGGTSLVFEVKRPDNNEPAWRYSDPGRTKLRLHMKRVS